MERMRCRRSEYQNCAGLRGAEAGVNAVLRSINVTLITSLSLGIGDDKTQVTRRAELLSSRFHLCQRPGHIPTCPPFQSSNASPYNLQVSYESVIAAGVYALPQGPRRVMSSSPAPHSDTNGNSLAADYVYTESHSNTFNFGAVQGMFPSSERYGGYTSFTHKVCDDQLVVYGDMLYENSKTHNELAPSATGSFETKGQQTIAIPPNSPLPGGVTPVNTPTFAETGLPVDAFNPFNPFNQIISGGSRARLAEFGNRKIDSDVDAFLSTMGVRGDKLFDGNWGYDAGFRYSQVKDTEKGTFVSVNRFKRILNAADSIFDPTSADFIGTTVPFNPFGDFRVPIPSNAIPVDFATIHTKDVQLSKLATLDLNVYSTQLFKLPAGGVGIAFGGQFRRENIVQSPDEEALMGDVIGFLERLSHSCWVVKTTRSTVRYQTSLSLVLKRCSWISRS